MRLFLLAAMGAIGLILLLSGCIQPPSQPNSPIVTEPAPQAPVLPPAQNDTSPCQKGSILEKDECFALLANSSGNGDYCEKIYSSDKKDDCLFPFARGDGAKCEKLFSSDLRSNCFLSYARAKDNLTTCSRIGNEGIRMQCLKELSPPCSLEEDDLVRAKCLAFAKSDYTICKSTSCLMDFAKEKGEPGACDLIKQEELPEKYACRALARKDPSQCDGADNFGITDACYFLYAKLAGNPFACGLASKGSPYKHSCYIYFAIKNKDWKFCTKLTPETERDYCFMNYSKSTDDYLACGNISNSINNAKCLIDIARDNGNMAACNSLQYGTVDTCSNMVLTGIGVKDPSTCADVASDMWRDKCYIYSAEHFRNQTLCNFVNDTGRKKSCLSPFQYS